MTKKRIFFPLFYYCCYNCIPFICCCLSFPLFYCLSHCSFFCLQFFCLYLYLPLSLFPYPSWIKHNFITYLVFQIFSQQQEAYPSDIGTLFNVPTLERPLIICRFYLCGSNEKMNNS